MRPRRVAVVVPALHYGGGVSTAGTFLYRLLAESERYAPDLVSLATSRTDESSVRLLAPATWLRGVRVDERGWEGTRYRHVGAVLAELEPQRYRPRRVLSELLNTYDLVQVVSGTPAWALAAREVTPPVVLQAATLASAERAAMLAAHGGVRGAWNRAMTRLTSRLDDRALQESDALFVMNEWMRSYVQSRAPSKHVELLPPGVDVERLTPSRENRPGHILSVGRFSDPRKNVGGLFRAYARLCERLVNPPPLVLAGLSGPSPEALELAGALGIRNRIVVKVGVSASELVRLYQEAFLFVLSSDEEGFGIVLLEAMACGVPVVSTRCGGPEVSVVHGETGFLSPVGDPEALAAHMEQMLVSEPLRDAMGVAARSRVVRHFSIKVLRDRVLAVYDHLLAEQARSGDVRTSRGGSQAALPVQRSG